MVRAWMAGLLVSVLIASATLAPAVGSRDPLVPVTKVNPDGTTEQVYAQLVRTDPPSPFRLSLDQEAPEAGSAPPPSEDTSALLEREKGRPTRTITFYGHVFGAGMVAPANGEDFGPDGPQPANTIFPKGDGNLGLGFNDLCADSVPQDPAGANSGPCDKDPNNKLAFFLTAGPVQVHQREEFRYSLLHNEHGRTKDVVLDKAQDITAGMWMSLDLFGWQVGNGGDDTNCVVFLPPDVGCPYPYWGWDPAHWPQWVVEAKLYMVELGEYGQGASEPPPIFEKWNSGDVTVVAEGALPPTDVQNGIPNQPNVHNFVVNLGKPLVDVIPKTKDLVVVFNFYSLINGQKVAPGQWRIWGGEVFPSTFTLPVKNAVDVELVIPQFVHDKLLIHSVIGSAWGSYDVDVASAKVTVLDDGNRPADMLTVRRVGDYQVAHGAHFKPVNVTWIWDYKADKLRPGTYKVQVEACNHQHSACEMTEGGFTIDGNLAPVDIRIGRQGQRTVTEGQLNQITGGGSNAQTFTSADLDLDFIPLDKFGNLLTRGAPSQAAPSQGSDLKASKEGAPLAVPGVEPLLAAIAVMGVALAARRRGF